MNRNELIPGVLGGMGPEATIDFMSRVMALTPARADQDHLRLFVDHNPKVPDRQAAILDGGDDPGAELAAMAMRLEAAGADFLVLVCNSAHAFLDKVAAQARIPIISIIDESVRETAVLAPHAHRVGIMATDGLLASGLYQTALRDMDREPVLPEADELAQLMSLIRRIKAGDKSTAVAQEMGMLAELLASAGAEAIIAGCTEIPLVLDSANIAANVSVPVISSTDVLARRTVELARRIVPLPGRTLP